MASRVGVCNSALLQLGADTIIALSEASTRAKLCNHFYDEIRDSTLREFPWNFAVRYLDFGATETASPEFEFANSFAFPSAPNHVLRVWRAEYLADPYKVVGRKVYSNLSTFKARCIIQITDEASFDALFYEALAAHLAAVIAWPLTKNTKLRQDQFQVYQLRLQAAQEIDSQEGTADAIQSDDLLDVRGG